MDFIIELAKVHFFPHLLILPDYILLVVRKAFFVTLISLHYDGIFLLLFHFLLFKNTPSIISKSELFLMVNVSYLFVTICILLNIEKRILKKERKISLLIKKNCRFARLK